MKSLPGFLAAVVFLSLLPVAVLYQMLFANGVEIITHLLLAAGSILISVSVFDFKVTKWITWVGCISAGALAAIFLLQGVSLLVQADWLTYFAYQLLGQRLEALLVDLLIFWFAAMLLVDSQGKTRILGFTVLTIVIGFEVYRYSLSYFNAVPAESLKLSFLLMIVWFLLESKKKVSLEVRNNQLVKLGGWENIRN